jgi:hypothetical protein
MVRAKATAKSIADFHSGKLELVTLPDLQEQDHGPEVEAAMRSGDMSLALKLRTGVGFFGVATSSQSKRQYCAPGGESLNRVVRRGIFALELFFDIHGCELASPPTELLEDSRGPEASKLPESKLPDNVPHIVIVSHNIFL